MRFHFVLVLLVAGALATSDDLVTIADLIQDNQDEASQSSSPCNYHEEPAQVHPQVTVATLSATTCYNATRTSTRYEIIGKAIVETHRGCEVLCDTKPECAAFSVKDEGFSTSCVMLSSQSSSESCSAPTTVFLKNTAGCVARTDITAGFGNDPCIDEFVPNAFRGVGFAGKVPICDRSTDQFIFIRAIDALGRRITLDNDQNNWIQKAGKAWELRYDYENHTVTMPIVAAACVIAGGDKCPCAPLKHLTQHPVWEPNYPVTIERPNPCNKHTSVIWFNNAKAPRENIFHVSAVHTDSSFVTCKAGMWMFRPGYGNMWGVTALACYDE